MRIGVLGTGKVVHGNYLPFLSSQPDVEFVCRSRTRDKAEACAEEFGGLVVDSLQELVAAASGCRAGAYE